MSEVDPTRLILFCICAVLAVISAIMMVSRRNPVHSALWLVTNFLAVAVLYLSLSAQFVAAVQVAVYAGAIMVLFLFVIMLLNLGTETRWFAKTPRDVFLGSALAALLCAGLVTTGIVGQLADEAQLQLPVRGLPQRVESPLPEFHGRVVEVAWALFTRHVFAFELITLLLLTAMVGIVVLGKRRREIQSGGADRETHPAPPKREGEVEAR